MADSIGRKTVRLHISLYEMPDGMYVASCAEVPSCRILRQNKEHAFTDARTYILQFIREREAEGRAFTLPEIRAVDFPVQTASSVSVTRDRSQENRLTGLDDASDGDSTSETGHRGVPR